jgi:hypothetical protein
VGETEGRAARGERGEGGCQGELAIGRKGFRKKFGYQMFKTALLRKRPEIRRLLGPDAALEIADRLNGNKKY